MEAQKKLAIACQGGGSHTAFTAGVLKEFLAEGIHHQYQITGLSGTSGGGICAAAAWYGLLKTARGSSYPPYKWLVDFWKDNSAISFWEQSLLDWQIQTLRWQDSGLIPAYAANPYATGWLLELMKLIAPRTEYFDFKRLLEKHINFGEIEHLIESSSPRLLMGAVDILSGEFKAFDSEKGEIRVKAVMASAGIPNLFKAIKIGKSAYWDGLFSQNPPIRELIEVDVRNRPDEIWIVQINPKERSTEPMTAQDILDRRNELAGNLSLYQEIRFLKLVNQWIEQGAFNEDLMAQVKPIQIRWIEMSSEVSDRLDYASKLDRSPSFINMLMADGVKQAKSFLRDLNGI